MYRCGKCGGRLARPQVEPDLKPFNVFYRHPYNKGKPALVSALVYAVDERHALEMAPQLRTPGMDLRLNELEAFSAEVWK